jgi:hypothetical protein
MAVLIGAQDVAIRAQLAQLVEVVDVVWTGVFGWTVTWTALETPGRWCPSVWLGRRTARLGHR